MSDKFDKKSDTDTDKFKKIDEFFNKFEDNTNDGTTSVEDFLSRFDEIEKKQQEETAEIEARHQTRMDRLNDKKTKSNKESILKHKVSKKLDDEENIMSNSTNTATHKRKHRLNPKKFILFLVGLFLICCLAVGGYAISVIVSTPKIDTDQLYTFLSENSVLYDDEGNVIDNIFAYGQGTRTNVQYSDLPKNLVDSFVALEDKTFWKHHGFNFVRILGAIKESVFTGGNISGTSTITQQLARNVYLSDVKSDRTLRRKVQEAYYTVVLERNLEKEQIIEAYLNTIYLGNNAYGVQAASEAYFSKDVGDLDLLESAALAALPQAPHSNALIKKIEPENITNPEDPNILYKDDQFFYVYNDVSEKRRNLCLRFMNEQELITAAELSDALADNLKEHMKPSSNGGADMSSYFADYVIGQVTSQLMEEMNLSEAEAKQKIYTNGLQIYTTLNSDMQNIAEAEFSNHKNFPGVANLNKDKNKNIINESGNIMLYNYDTYFQSDGSFVLNSDEYKVNSDGSITIYKGKRVNIYKVAIQGGTDYNLEFKDLYSVEDGIFYNIKGGVIAIPAKFKSRDGSGNLVVDASLFDDNPDILKVNSNNITISSDHFTLRQKVVQPQSAMVISDPYTGAIKTMVGGRNTVGRLLFNRATSPSQPGSSIKPIGVYGPALQASVDAMNSGSTMKFTDSGGSMFGDYFTASSIIDDSPLTIQGKVWPKNWYSGYRGPQTLRNSVEQSINVNAVRTFQQLGVQKSVAFLKRVGISSVVESGAANDLNAAALALGGMTDGISPLEMASAYSSFVNDGKYSEPMAFTKVVNKRGEILIENSLKTTQAMDSGVAYIMRDMLLTTVSRGLGSKAAISNQPVGGKTGTTTDNYDAWFVGFTPQYSAAVWIGNDMNLELSQGSVSAARLWSNIMGKVCAGIPKGSYHPKPSNVISVRIDKDSGKLPSSLAPESSITSEYFVKGTEPKTVGNVHTTVTVCAQTGYLATPSCPTTRTVIGAKHSLGGTNNGGDMKSEVPRYYCSTHNPDPSTYAVDPSGHPHYNFEGTDVPNTGPAIDGNNPNGTPDNGNGNGNGTTNNGDPTVPPNNGGQPTPPPNDGNTDENGNSTIPDWLLPH